MGAGSAAITNNSAPVSAAGGTTVFRFTLSAGSATVTNDGGPVNGLYTELGNQYSSGH
jgi:hypothetical protein